MLSESLQEAMHEALGRKEQVMLFLNRRGYSGSVVCVSCGHAMRCPHCEVSLTLHTTGNLVCHYCGYTTPMPAQCPECGSRYLRTFRYGTQQVEDRVKQIFPNARVLRLDRDTAQGKDGELNVLSAFAGHEADILIGTQMIVKGHDFPDVTLMGILLADLSLNLPDYTASERTFQLLTQAAGRAGRADREGRVLIQTCMPEHYAIRCAAAQDYDAFYEREMRFRSDAGYPPAGSLLAVHMSCLDKDHLILAAGYVRKFLERVKGKEPVAILGPVDEPVARIADVWRMVLYLKGGTGAGLRRARGWLEKYIGMNEGFSNIEITFETTI
jgi:primosomal protein N' (replication factor Y)